MTTILYFDGLCEPRNPGGWGCYGWLVKQDGATVASGHGLTHEPGPASTNNAAEYAALIAGLEALGELDLAGAAVEVRGDSQLVVNQAAGLWSCNAAHLQPLLSKAQALGRRLGVRTWQWVPRDQNAEADRLAHEAYQTARAALGQEGK